MCVFSNRSSRGRNSAVYYSCAFIDDCVDIVKNTSIPLSEHVKVWIWVNEKLDSILQDKKTNLKKP